jgi:hypothetical protein
MGPFCIVNIEDIRLFAKIEAKRLPVRAHREWLERTVLRHVVTVQDSLQPSAPSRTELAAPHVSRASAAGEPTLRFKASTKLTREVADVVDWLAGLPGRDPGLDRKLRRVTFSDACAKSRRWHEQLRKNAERRYASGICPDPKGAPVILDEPSLGHRWHWVWLKDSKAREAEGIAMGHCVGSGGYESLSGSEAILSLRDPHGVPHVTLHLKEAGIIQVVTRGNGRVPERYGIAVERAAAVIGLRMLLVGSPGNVIADGWFKQDDPQGMRRAIHIEGGLIHRSICPAVKWDDGKREWYFRGKLHRENCPAVEWADGTKIFYRHGQLHRDDGPAIEHADGTEKWYVDGQLHRDDGPAVKWANGAKEWYWCGQLHREDGPALKWADGREDWYRHGQLHRDDGPAVKYADGTETWYLDGARISLWRRLSGIFH